jgi:RNA polymerase sigma factor (sigma-70 family)
MRLKTEPRWSLTTPALARLLQRLGDEPEQAAREYDTVRRWLIGFFERRGILSSEELADETLDRVARRLDRGETIEHLKAYFYGVARRVALEWRKQRAQQRAAEREYSSPSRESSAEDEEVRLVCLQRCLQALPPETRALVLDYHRSRLGDRKRLAESFGITYTNLKTRVFRLRLRLEECVQQCLEAPARVTDDPRGPQRVKRS